jgi:IclR family transcriptional regulator, acetate operon repressor
MRLHAHSDGTDPAAPVRPTHVLSSVDNALTLLLLFREQEVIRISDASRTLGVSPSTASRVMAMLQYKGFAQQDPQTRAYRPGPALVDIGLATVSRIDARGVVRPYLEALAREVNETAHFVALDGAEAVFLDGIESTRSVKTTLRIGQRRPAHAMSGGKALLAELPDAEVRRRYPHRRLPRLTEETIATRAELERELGRIRERGYAMSIRESDPEVAGLAIAIPHPSGVSAGAMVVSLPTSRFDERSLMALLEPLRVAATGAGHALASAPTAGLGGRATADIPGNRSV